MKKRWEGMLGTLVVAATALACAEERSAPAAATPDAAREEPAVTPRAGMQ